MLLVTMALAADPTFEVRPTGWVQPRFTWQAEGAEADTGFGLTARIGAEAMAKSLPFWARVEVNLLPSPSLQDAFAAWQPAPAVAIFAGQFRVPYSLQALSAETRRQLPLDAEAVSQASFGRDLGVMTAFRLPVAGKVRAMLDVAAVNGEGENELGNLGGGLCLAVRGAIVPLGARERPQEGTLREPYLGVGGGWVRTTGGGSLGDAEESAVGVDVQVAAGPVSFQAEYLDRAVSEAAGPSPEWSSRGAYGQLASFIPAPWVNEHLELVVRGGWSSPRLEVGSAVDPDATVAIDAGVNLYAPEAPASVHDVKLQLAYRHVIQLEGTERDDDRADVAAVVRF